VKPRLAVELVVEHDLAAQRLPLDLVDEGTGRAVVPGSEDS
jgi:hypothetical protein